MADNEKGQATQVPNVCLARNQKPVTENGPVNMGTITVELPDEATQRSGFYTPHAAAFITQFYPAYKYLRRTAPPPMKTQIASPAAATEEDPVDRLNQAAATDTEFQQERGETQDAKA